VPGGGAAQSIRGDRPPCLSACERRDDRDGRAARAGSHGGLPPRVLEPACALVLLVLLAVLAAGGCGRETVVVPRERAGEIVALFGDAWSAPIGELRVTGGRMDGGVIRIALAGPDREAAMRLEHARVGAPSSPDDTVVERAGRDVRIVLTCTPACDAATLAPLRALAERVLDANPDRLWVPARGFAIGRERHVALALALVLAGLGSGLGLLALWRAGPFSLRAADAALVTVLTLAATALLGAPSIANWYSNNLPATVSVVDAGDPNGIAGLLLQAAVRSVVPWTDRTLFALNLLLHAVTGGVFYLAFRALAVERAVAMLALALWSVLPMSVRIGWSDAMHVQVELLFALLLLVWLRAQQDARWPERALALVLVAFLPLVRLETLVLTPLPVLFGWLTGDRSPRRRLVDAGAYAAAWAFSAYVVDELYVRRYGPPIPDLAARPQALADPGAYLLLVRQFVTVDSEMVNWFPWPATALLAIGVVAVAVRRPLLLVAVAVAFCLPQLLLDRSFNAEGIVGARYFLPLLPLLALLAASGLAAVAAGLGRVLGLATAVPPWRRRRAALQKTLDDGFGVVAAGLVAMVALLAIVFAARPLYDYEYAFQGEHAFLRQALAALPAGARVLHLPAREDDRLRADPDCCLDLPVGPLALAFPSIHFEPIPIRPERGLPAAVDDRTYYYEGALCRLAPTAASEGRNPGLSQVLAELCAALARDPRLELVASAIVPSNGFRLFLQPGGVPVRLYRIVGATHASPR